MGYKVTFAPQALARLEEIVTRIAQDNPAAALKFGMRLVDHAGLLADFPELGRP
jgi:plasmid stabilization system protein ParE